MGTGDSTEIGKTNEQRRNIKELTSSYKDKESSFIELKLSSYLFI